MPLPEALQDYVVQHELTTDPSVVVVDRVASLLDDILVSLALPETGPSDPILDAARELDRAVQGKQAPWEEVWRMTPVQFEDLKRARALATGGQAGRKAVEQEDEVPFWHERYVAPYDLNPDIYLLPRARLCPTKRPPLLSEDPVTDISDDEPLQFPTLADALDLHWLPTLEQKDALKAMMQTIKSTRAQGNDDAGSPMWLVDADDGCDRAQTDSPRPISPPLQPRTGPKSLHPRRSESPRTGIRALLRDMGQEVAPSSQELLDIQEWNRIEGGFEWSPPQAWTSISDPRPSSPPNLMPHSSSPPVTTDLELFEPQLLVRRPSKRSFHAAFDHLLATVPLEQVAETEDDGLTELRRMIDQAAPTLMDLVSDGPVLEPPLDLPHLPTLIPVPPLPSARPDRSTFRPPPFSSFHPTAARTRHSHGWAMAKAEGLKVLNIELSWTPITFREATSLEKILDVDVPFHEPDPSVAVDDGTDSIIQVWTRAESVASEPFEIVSVDSEPVGGGTVGQDDEDDVLFSTRVPDQNPFVPSRSSSPVGSAVKVPSQPPVDGLEEPPPSLALSSFQRTALSPIAEGGSSSAERSAPTSKTRSSPVTPSDGLVPPWRPFPSSESDSVMLINVDPPSTDLAEAMIIQQVPITKEHPEPDRDAPAESRIDQPLPATSFAPDDATPTRQDVSQLLRQYALARWNLPAVPAAPPTRSPSSSPQSPAQPAIPPPPDSIGGLYRLKPIVPPVVDLGPVVGSVRLLQNRHLHQRLATSLSLEEAPNDDGEGTTITVPDLDASGRAVVFLRLNKLPRAVIRHEELEAVDAESAPDGDDRAEACFTTVYRLAQTYSSVLVVFEAYQAAATVSPYPYTPPVTQALAELRDVVDQYEAHLASNDVSLRCDVAVAESVEAAASLTVQWLCEV